MTNKLPATTIEFIDELKYKLFEEGKIPRPSDTAVSTMLPVDRTMISMYRNKGHTFSDETAIIAAELLELPVGYVIACIHAERAKSKEAKSMWEGMAKQFGSAAAAAFLVANLSLCGSAQSLEATDSPALSGFSSAEVCILC